jgi:hypothetical protein
VVSYVVWDLYAPTTFLHVMDDVFWPFLDDFVIVYLDNIPIFSQTWDEHVRHVKRVLDTLKGKSCM